jgi:hypothetical protein
LYFLGFLDLLGIIKFMNNKIIWLVVVIVLVGGLYFINNKDVIEESNAMSFFVTSENPGMGANFGGLVGADAHCQALASKVGAGDKTWKAYLSATATGSESAVNARDRIGDGPWYNVNGVLIAGDLEELHGENMINKETALSEKGEVINGRGDTPNVHDILTGSTVEGLASSGEGDTTCGNWTSEGEGSAIVGHHDRRGLDELPPALSWNSSHGSRGCSLENLNGTGGGGLLYCFATE